LKSKIFSILFTLVLVCSFNLIPAMPAMASGTGNITVNIKDLQGNDIAIGDHVSGDLWGVSQPKGGGDDTWLHMKKNAVLVGGVSSVTWTTSEIEAEVNCE